MSAAAANMLDTAHEPWTEATFLALPPNRQVELLDGSLLVSPMASHRHQWLGHRLCSVLNAAAPAGLRAMPPVNVRVGRNRILISDVTVIANVDMSAKVTDAEDVRLVVEVTSPGNAYVDRGLKPQLYSEAGIPHYLRIELLGDQSTALMHELCGDRYVETGRFGPGEVTVLTDPFAARFDLGELIGG
ncbi:MAG: Uma2 family endonuclease [Actinomycetota bacterium]|nr:Uma2 family endonuclease [Actinomycetota bacterium]